MRFNTTVEFHKETSEYNPDTSREDIVDTIVSTIDANVTDASTQRNVVIFGKWDVNSKVIRSIDLIDFDWSYALIDGSPKKYILQSAYSVKKMNSILVGEKQ